jgi:hypothetical protein
VEQGSLHGIEVVNEREYYPEAHRWCIEKNLTMLSNSDVHEPVFMDYDPAHGDHRAYTLVFARDPSPEAIREALFDHRTVVVLNNLLAGAEVWLRQIFSGSVKIKNPAVILKSGESAYLQIHNSASVDFELEREKAVEGLQVPGKVTLFAGKTVLLSIRRTAADIGGKWTVRLNFRVTNLKTTPDDNLKISLPVTIIDG